MNIKRVCLATVGILSLVPAFAWATPLTTGGAPVVPSLGSGSPGTFLAQTNFSAAYFDPSVNLVGGGVLQEALFRDSSGAVDFYFQLQTPDPGQPSTESLLQAIAANFGSFTTDVSYRLDGTTLNSAGASGFVTGTVIPTTATRNPDSMGNNAVFFNFPPGLFGGVNSAVLEVATNASSFRTIGDLGFNSGTPTGSVLQGAINFYSPDGPVVAPVPDRGATALLLALGLIALFGTDLMVRSRATPQKSTIDIVRVRN
jgi:hypothetical protein